MLSRLSPWVRRINDSRLRNERATVNSRRTPRIRAIRSRTGVRSQLERDHLTLPQIGINIDRPLSVRVTAAMAEGRIVRP